MDSLKKQALTEHLSDLRQCVVVSLLAVAVGFGVAYSKVEAIGEWFFQPLFAVLPLKSTLIFTSYQEGFFFT